MHLPVVEINALIKLLQDASPVIDEAFVTNVISPLPPLLRQELPPASENALRRITTTLHHLNQSGPLTDGSLPIVVLLETMQVCTSDLKISNTARRLQMMVGAQEDDGAPITVAAALADMRVAGATLFVDRESLRQQIRRAHDPGGPPAIVVSYVYILEYKDDAIFDSVL